MFRPRTANRCCNPRPIPPPRSAEVKDHADVLGNLILEPFGHQMNAEERKLFKTFVDASDAKGLVVWSLNFQ
jgi:hypothetical protein